MWGFLPKKTISDESRPPEEFSDLFELILDSLNDHIAVIDSDGTIKWVSEAWKQFSLRNNGLPHKTLVGANYLKVCHPSNNEGDIEAPRIYNGILDVIEGRTLGFYFEYPCHSPTESRWFIMQMTPIGGKCGAQKFVISHQDITKRKCAEIALQESNKKLAQAALTMAELAKREKSIRQEAEKDRAFAEEANVAKSFFLATMSHEIRTPMNGILGMVNTLLGERLEADRREKIQLVKESAENLLNILNDILDLSKIEAGRMELSPVDFHFGRFLDASVALWRSRTHSKGIEFNLQNELTENTIVRADSGRIRQVLYNLIGNAVKFTEAGSIDVVVRERSQDNDRLRLRIEVQDTGIGMDEKAIAKLFLPFSQADGSTTRKYGGTGLGLAISKAIVELHHGEIGVESTPGVGSCFWVEFTVEKAIRQTL